MSKYKVGNFVSHSLPSGDMVIQNQKGVVKINNHKMGSLIEYIDENNLTYISNNELERYMSANVDEAVDFLKKYGVIKSLSDYATNFNVERLHIVTNDNKFEKNIMYLIESLEQEEQIDIVNNNKLETEIKSCDLVVVFLNPYDKKMVRKIYDLVQNSKCLLLMSYVYNSNLYIDNLYNPKWKNPCHYCNMGSIESQLRVSVDGSLTYQGLIDTLYHEDESFAVELQISTVELINFITLIINRLDNLVFRTNGNVLYYTESLGDINNSTMYDTNNNRIYTDTSIHWEMCDCYE